MISRMRDTSSIAISLLLLLLLSTVSAHTVITYPGWRGNNLLDDGTESDLFVQSGGLGVGPNNTYPYGRQWIYPCGGMPLTTNRTLWPVGGGALAIQPGWFTGHLNAFFYVNMGMGTLPVNMSLPMVPVFQINGPSKDPYTTAGFCLPQVPTPSGVSPQIGQNATIQVVEVAVHGASLYSCVDITFADPEHVAPVNSSNCVNSSSISFSLVFASTGLTSDSAIFRPAQLLASIPLVAALLLGLLC